MEREPLRKGSRKDGDFPQARFMLLYHARKGTLLQNGHLMGKINWYAELFAVFL